MAYRRVLLTNIVAHEDPRLKPHAMLRAGLGYLAQALQDGGVDCAVVDLALGDDFDRLLAEIGRFRPELIGVSLFTYRYSRSYERMEELKARFPDIPIICGGPHVSTFQEQVLAECRAVDFALPGEAEESLVRFCRGEAPADVPGLIYRDAGAARRSAAPYHPPDIHALAFPRYAGFELQNYPVRDTPPAERFIPIVTSRGCPYACIYCPVKTAIGRRFRARAPESVVEEVAYWHQAGYRRFAFIDDNFTLLRDRAQKIAELLAARAFPGISISLNNGIRADKVDPELFALLRRAGVDHLAIGVESGDEAVLAGLKKSESVETIGRAVAAACAAGFSVDLLFLIGSPGETLREVQRSFAFARRYPVDKVFFFNLIPYPGTELFSWVQEHARMLYPPAHYLNHIASTQDIPVFETEEFPAADRRRALRRARREVALCRTRYYERLLAAKGWPRALAAPVARLYGFEGLQRLFNDVAWLKAIKRRLKG